MQKAVVALLLIDALDEGLALPASSNEVTCLLLCEALESALKLGVNSFQPCKQLSSMNKPSQFICEVLPSHIIAGRLSDDRIQHASCTACHMEQ